MQALVCQKQDLLINTFADLMGSQCRLFIYYRCNVVMYCLGLVLVIISDFRWINEYVCRWIVWFQRSNRNRFERLIVILIMWTANLWQWIIECVKVWHFHLTYTAVLTLQQRNLHTIFQRCSVDFCGIFGFINNCRQQDMKINDEMKMKVLKHSISRSTLWKIDMIIALKLILRRNGTIFYINDMQYTHVNGYTTQEHGATLQCPEQNDFNLPLATSNNHRRWHFGRDVTLAKLSHVNKMAAMFTATAK